VEVGSLRRRHNGERGFVFSLDGCLALVLIMIVVASIASAGETELSYGQHGYLTLQRYANDALETMSLTGSMDNVADLVIKGNLNQAKTLVRQELGKVLPGEVQFKLVIGQESNPDLVVYPSDKTNWDNAFKNAGERAVAVRVLSRRPTTQHILAWLDDPLDEAFMDEVLKGTNWDVTRVSTDADFRSRILQPSSNGGLYYDVIFVPDDNTVVWSQTTKQRLLTYNSNKGRLVFGGETLYTNCYPIKTLTDWTLLEYFGVGEVYPDGWGSVLAGPVELRGKPMVVGQPEFNEMVITDISEEVTLPPPFSVGYKVQYSGQKYEQYLYTPRTTHPLLVPKVVADWENVPSGWRMNPTPWPAIIWWGEFFREPGSPGWVPGWFYQTVLFNMRLAQSAMDNTTNPPNAGKDDWVLLARRAIGINISEFKPATLYVWRGEAV
jgi:hypothetical protein